jgi:hypothetical protein
LLFEKNKNIVFPFYLLNNNKKAIWWIFKIFVMFLLFEKNKNIVFPFYLLDNNKKAIWWIFKIFVIFLFSGKHKIILLCMCVKWFVLQTTKYCHRLYKQNMWTIVVEIDNKLFFFQNFFFVEKIKRKTNLCAFFNKQCCFLQKTKLLFPFSVVTCRNGKLLYKKKIVEQQQYTFMLFV